MAKPSLTPINERWQLARLPSTHEAHLFAAQHFISCANRAIKERGLFTVALSGGSTPKAIYQLLATPDFHGKVDWNRVLLFWSDERAVPPDHPDSNYRMAMEAGLGKLPLLPEHIFRMHADTDLEVNAAAYDHLIQEKAGGQFDLMMLGMGEDGHTASLFPDTEALKVTTWSVVANYIPKFDAYRMTVTFPCINASRNIALYVLGESKRPMLTEILRGPENRYPVQRVGTPHHPALWITDLKI
ncbi:MAG: 6-phosphogluconolactonase [Parachlamydiales bacterium]